MTICIFFCGLFTWIKYLHPLAETTSLGVQYSSKKLSKKDSLVSLLNVTEKVDWKKLNMEQPTSFTKRCSKGPSSKNSSMNSLVLVLLASFSS